MSSSNSTEVKNKRANLYGREGKHHQSRHIHGLLVWQPSDSDNNANGYAFSFSLSLGAGLSIDSLTVDLTIAGGWNGDLYAYLSHGSGFSVLLNRSGSTAGNPGGSGVSGLNVSFADSYLTDIHTALNNPLTGNFAPDGRNVNPYNALDTDPRTAMLGSFNGIDPNGTWTLFFADVSPPSVSTLQSWTVNIGVTVPEPGSTTLVGLMIALGWFRRCHVRR